jgi:hypothetical protein
MAEVAAAFIWSTLIEDVETETQGYPDQVDLIEFRFTELVGYV